MFCFSWSSDGVHVFTRSFDGIDVFSKFFDRIRVFAILVFIAISWQNLPFFAICTRKFHSFTILIFWRNSRFFYQFYHWIPLFPRSFDEIHTFFAILLQNSQSFDKIRVILRDSLTEFGIFSQYFDGIFWLLQSFDWISVFSQSFDKFPAFCDFFVEFALFLFFDRIRFFAKLWQNSRFFRNFYKTPVFSWFFGGIRIFAILWQNSLLFRDLFRELPFSPRSFDRIRAFIVIF